MDPEITAGASAIMGGAVVFAGRYLYAKLITGNNGNGSAAKQLQMYQPQCPDHPHLVEEVKEIKGDLKKTAAGIHTRLDKVSEGLARIEGKLG